MKTFFRYKSQLILLFALAFLISCNNKNENKQTKNALPTSKLDNLFKLSTDTVVAFYDLSNDSIKELPNLTKFSIRNLDLSGNSLSELSIELLPKELEALNVSNNKLNGHLLLHTKEPTSLFEINLSNNQLDSVSISLPLRKIILSHNDLTYLTFSHSAIEYLDISHNPKMSNVVYFFPEKIDTIIHNNILNEKPLVFWLYGHKSK